MDERIAEIAYNYDVEKSGIGEMGVTPVQIDFGNHSRESIDLSLDMLHPNYLPCRFYDNEMNALFHFQNSMSLEQYINDLKIQGITPIISHRLAVYQIQHHLIVHPLFRSLIKVMLEFIFFVWGKDKCLKDITWKNLCVRDNDLKFWRVEFVDSTEQRKADNMAQVSKLIAKIFSGHTIIPKVLDHLYEKLTMKYRSGDTYIMEVLNHLCLKSPKETMRLIRNFYDKSDIVLALFSQQNRPYEIAVRSIHGGGGPINKGFQGWTDIFDPAKNDYGPIWDCFFHGRRNNNYNGHGAAAYEVNYSLVRFWRNIVAHAGNQIAHYTKNHTDDEELHIETLILWVYEDQVLKLMDGLAQNGILENFV